MPLGIKPSTAQLAVVSKYLSVPRSNLIGPMLRATYHRKAPSTEVKDRYRQLRVPSSTVEDERKKSHMHYWASYLAVAAADKVITVSADTALNVVLDFGTIKTSREPPAFKLPNLQHGIEKQDFTSIAKALSRSGDPESMKLGTDMLLASSFEGDREATLTLLASVVFSPEPALRIRSPMYARARKHLADLVKSEKDAPAMILQGKIHSVQGSTDAAIKLLLKAVEVAPPDRVDDYRDLDIHVAEALSLIAVIRISRGESGDAVITPLKQAAALESPRAMEQLLAYLEPDDPQRYEVLVKSASIGLHSALHELSQMLLENAEGLDPWVRQDWPQERKRLMASELLRIAAQLEYVPAFVTIAEMDWRLGAKTAARRWLEDAKTAMYLKPEVAKDIQRLEQEWAAENAGRVP